MAAYGAKQPVTGMSAPGGDRKSQATGQTDVIDPEADIRPLGPALKIAYARVERIGLD